MAYKTEIQIGVKGTAQLDRLRQQVTSLNKKVNQIDESFGRGVQSVKRYEDTLKKAADTLRKAKMATDDEQRAVKQYVTALNNANAAQQRQNSLIDQEITRRGQATQALRQYNAELAAPRQPGSMAGSYLRGGGGVARTGVQGGGSSQYPSPIGPQPDAAGAFMQRTQAASQAASRLTAEFLASQRAARNLAEEQRRINSAEFIARTDAAAKAASRQNAEFIRQQRITKEIQKNLRSGTQFKEPIGPKPPKKKTRLEQFADFGLGAGFPLLFGGGAGQVAGGALGTLLGGGGPQSFGLQIAFSAIGGIVEDLIANTRELSTNLDTLNLDNLEASAIRVNAQLRTQIDNLVRAGEFDKAKGVAAREVEQQTGLDAQTLQDSAGVTSSLVTSFNELLSAAGALASIIGVGITAPLTLIVDIVTMIVKGANNLISIVGKILRAIPGVDFIFGLIRKNSEKNNEELQKQRAKIQEIIRESQARLELETQVANLENQKTLGLTQAGKLKNLELAQEQEQLKLVAKQTKQTEELREKIKAGTETQIAAAQASLKAEQDLEQQQLKRKQLLELLQLKYQGQLEAIDKQSKVIEYTAELERQRLKGSQDLLSAQTAGEQQALSFQSSLLQKVGATVAAQENAVEIAKLQRDATAETVKFEQNRLDLAVATSQAKEQQLQAQIREAEAQALTTPVYGEVVTKLKESLVAQQGVTELAQQAAVNYQAVGNQLNQNAENLVGQEQTSLRIAEIENTATQRVEQLDLQKQALQDSLAILENTLSIEQSLSNLALARNDLRQTELGNQVKDLDFIEKAREAGLSRYQQLQLMSVEQRKQRDIEADALLIGLNRNVLAKKEENALREQFRAKLKAAELEYKAQLLSIDASEAKARIEAQIIDIQNQQLRVQVKSLRIQALSIDNAKARAAAVAAAAREEQNVNKQIAQINRLAQSNLNTAVRQAEIQREIAGTKFNELQATIRSEELERRRAKTLGEIAQRSEQIAQSAERAASAQNKISRTGGGASGGKSGGGLRPGEKIGRSASTRLKIDRDIVDRFTKGDAGFKNIYEFVAALDRAQEARNKRKEQEAKIAEQRAAEASQYELLEPSKGAYSAKRLKAAPISSSQSVNITTGPVMQFDNEKYVSMEDFESVIKELSRSQASSSRSYGGRTYGGVG